MRLNFIFSFSPGPPLGLRGLAALLIVVTMLANGGQANSFPDYPYAELTVEEKGSLTSWGVIGQFTAWCMCQQVGRMRSKESLAAEEFAKAHAEYVKAVLRNPEYLRQCENEKRADARKFRPPPPTEVPDNLRMPAWWYMIYFYKIHECNCESKHTDPNYDIYESSVRCAENAETAASTMIVQRMLNPPPAEAAVTPDDWPNVPYLPLPPRPDAEGSAEQAPRLFSSSSSALSPAKVARSRAAANRNAALASMRRTLTVRLQAGRDAVAAGTRELRDQAGLKRRVGNFADSVREEVAAAAQLRAYNAKPPQGLGSGRMLNVPAVPGH